MSDATTTTEPSTALVQVDIPGALREFNLADAAIAELSAKYMPLAVSGLEDKVGLVAVHAARMHVRELRVGVEKKRKELKAQALRFGEAVDGEAKRITALLAPVEEHLVEEESRVEAERERRKRDAEALRRQLLAARMRSLADVGRTDISPLDVDPLNHAEWTALLASCTADHEAKLAREREERSAREAEDAARRAEDERLAIERRALQEEQAQVQAERARLDAERAEVERSKAAEARRLEDERRAAELKAKAEADAKAELARKAQEKRDKEEAKRLADERREARRPEATRLRDVANRVEIMDLPEGLTTESRVRTILAAAAKNISAIADELVK